MIKTLNSLSANFDDYKACVNTGVYNTEYITNFQKCVSFTPLIDNRNCFDVTTGEYTVPATGVYEITLAVNYGNVTARSGFACFVDGVNASEMFDIPNPQYCNLSSMIYVQLTQGQKIFIARLSNLGASPDSTTITIRRIA